MKPVAEAAESVWIGRGAFQMRRRWRTTAAGASGKANVGISNDKEGEMPSRRKVKVS